MKAADYLNSRSLIGLASRLTKDHGHRRDELIAETVLKLYEKFGDEVIPAGYYAAVCRNTFIDGLQSKLVYSEDVPVAMQELTPEDIYSSRQTMELLLQKVNSYEGYMKDVLMLLIADPDLTYQDVAGMIGRSKDSIKVRCGIEFNKLKKEIYK